MTRDCSHSAPRETRVTGAKRIAETHAPSETRRVEAPRPAVSLSNQGYAGSVAGIPRPAAGKPNRAEMRAPHQEASPTAASLPRSEVPRSRLHFEVSRAPASGPPVRAEAGHADRRGLAATAEADGRAAPMPTAWIAPRGSRLPAPEPARTTSDPRAEDSSSPKASGALRDPGHRKDLDGPRQAAVRPVAHARSSG